MSGMAKKVSKARTEEVTIDAMTDFRIFRFLSGDSIMCPLLIRAELLWLQSKFSIGEV